jgi:hypothetical protein
VTQRNRLCSVRTFGGAPRYKVRQPPHITHERKEGKQKITGLDNRRGTFDCFSSSCIYSTLCHLQLRQFFFPATGHKKMSRVHRSTGKRSGERSDNKQIKMANPLLY